MLKNLANGTFWKVTGSEVVQDKTKSFFQVKQAHVLRCIVKQMYVTNKSGQFGIVSLYITGKKGRFSIGQATVQFQVSSSRWQKRNKTEVIDASFR